MKKWMRWSALVAMAMVWSCASEPEDLVGHGEEEVVEPGNWRAMETVEGEPLSEQELEAMLQRLPPLEIDEEDEVEFKRRADSLPPPLTGEDIDGEWPPDLSRPVAGPTAEGPLRAQAFRPEGEVNPPFQVAVAFDRPVVEVGAVGTQETPPVTMTPEVEGRWRWLGTQTVVFEPDEQWSMATEFEVELRAGLEAVDGSQLEETLRFGFATPAPEVMTVRPSGQGVQTRDVPVAVVFNQKIDPVTAESITVRDSAVVPMEVAGAEERAEIAERYGLKGADEEGRVIVLTPQRQYDYDSTVRVNVDGPIKSKEGPVVGMESHSSTFSVHGPFRLTGVRCGLNSVECPPGSWITFEFTNPIDAEAAEPKVEAIPEVQDLQVRASGSRLSVRGDFRAQEEYELYVSGELIDRFGQELDGQRTGRIRVTDYPPFVAGPDQPMVVRPADASDVFPVMVAGASEFRVRVYDVSSGDWARFHDYRGHDAAGPGGSRVDERIYRFSAEERREVRQINLDLSSAFANGVGQAVVTIDQLQPWQGYRPFRRAYWVQKTDLGVDLSSDHQEMTARVTSLADGSDVAGAQIHLGRGRMLGTTDSRGTAKFEVPRGEESTRALRIVDGADELFIPPRGQLHLSFWHEPEWLYRQPATDTLWYVVDDRQIYKPGETVTIRGWVRNLERTPRGEPASVGEGTVSYTVREPRRNEIADGEVELDAFGGFEFEFDVPEEANLGTAQISMRLKAEHATAGHTHRVQFQEFRRPEFEVMLETDEGPHQVEERTSWEAKAAYYAGGEVSGAPATWRFSESSARYSPPGWRGWSFGQWRAWWSPWSRGGDSGGKVLPEKYRSAVQDQTDGRGRAMVEMEFERPERGFPRRVSGTVSVQDVDRQAWEANSSVLVHPSELYVGLRSEKNFVPRDEAWELEAVVVDVDGDVVEGREIEFALKRRGFDGLEKQESCQRTSAQDAVSCSFSDLTPGSYRVVATVEDEKGRPSESEMDFFVAGQDRSGTETAEEADLLLIPERDEYAPGDVARFSVQAPYYPLDAVLELRRDGSYHRERVELTEDDSIVEFAIEESMIPNVHVRVEGIGRGDGYEPDHFASGTLNLEVDRGPRTLGVELEPESDVIAPGQEMGVGARVTNQQGEPVEGAQVLLFAVDESVLALTNYQLADPVQLFYPGRQAGMSDIRTRSWLLLDFDEDIGDQLQEAVEAQRQERRAVPEDLAMGEAPEMARMAAPAPSAAANGGDGPEPIDVREVFDALAFYRSDLVTDAEGRVELMQQMPDSLTRYRIMAVALQGEKYFGSGESDVTAKKPLMVSPAPPRFLNVGDHFDLPVVVHNRGEEDVRVEVAVKGSPAIHWLETPGRRVTVPADDRLEVRFAARVDRAGTAKFQVAAASAEHADAELVEFPVLTPATTEAFATYGTIDADDDDAQLESLRVPQDVYTQFGGLEISTSSTQLQALTDAFIYLTNYPFQCAEQVASRMMSVLALYDVLDAFEAEELPTPEELRAAMDEWIGRLVQLQRGDGGFGFWPGSRSSHPFVSIHATHALWQAQQEGYSVNSHNLDRATRYLRNMERHLDSRYYSQRAKSTVESYALHVRHRMGDASTRELDGLVSKYGVEELSLEAMGWLLPLAEGTQWEERFLQRITGQVQETAATAEFQETFEVGAHRVLHTTRRTDGVVLDGLMQVEPDHYLVEKVVRGLLAHRQRGRWSNTQENVFIMMALRRYFDTYEDVEPDFVARAWLGDEHIAEHAFGGRTTERYGVDVPMSYLHEQGETLPVVFQRDGAGRMYYRMGVRYAPRSRQLDPLNEGFTVERVYEAVDDPEDVRRTENGWEIRSGARVRVELSMTIPARRYHVALVDWLPAGLEPLNPALAVTSVESDLTGASRDARRWGWWGRPWYEHQNLRDERVEAFASIVHQGVHTYSYVARATTPGEFIAMPAKAEEMYHPETFGRSMSEIVRVVDE